MPISIGVDIVDINRMLKIIERRGNAFVNRICTEYELTYIRKKDNYAEESTDINNNLNNREFGKDESASEEWKISTLSGIFAAKEAISKAMGTGIGRGVNLKEIEIKHSEFGAPYYHLSGKTKVVFENKGFVKTNLSISHDGGMAVAFCVLE